MKKRILALLVALTLVMSLAACGDPEYITAEAAQEVVFIDTGYSADTVEYLETELVEEEESVYYRVSFTGDGLEFVYTVDATSGAILSYPEF